MPTVGRVVHVGSPARLSYADLQVCIEPKGKPEARVPVEDLAVLICDFAPITVSVPLLAALTEGGVALVICGQRHLPEGLLLPMAGAALHTRVLRDQIGATEPRRKRIWQSIVTAKIAAQASVLAQRTGADHGLRALSRRVGSGDPENLEGRAARTYFPALFGSGFTRSPDRPGVNAMLNYGYAIVRAATARAVVGAGLHPALGVHHRNQYDAHALADDAMEPLRPLVDARVAEMVGSAPPPEQLSVELRARLLDLLNAEVRLGASRLPLFSALEQYAANLRECLAGEDRKLRCPVP